VAALETSIENHVASRIRLRRGLLGMSQSDLARTLGITFQQVQKYERGSNRVSVGKLYRLAEILDVPLTFFFDGLAAPAAGWQQQTAEAGDRSQSSILSRRELDMLRAWKTAPAEISDAIASLLRAVAGSDSIDGPDAGAIPAAGSATAMESTDLESDITPKPARRGRPPKAKTAATAAAAASNSNGRRRRGAIWDPSDIEKAAKAKR